VLRPTVPESDAAIESQLSTDRREQLQSPSKLSTSSCRTRTRFRVPCLFLREP